ncbi:copper resistance protein CopC [Klebsiella pneumoniae]|nr:copper resistance protein CopC [Klebsiella pneumoniae]
MGGDHSINKAPVSTTLDKGQYEVDWTALSVDGHKTQGKYTFTVK